MGHGHTTRAAQPRLALVLRDRVECHRARHGRWRPARWRQWLPRAVAREERPGISAMGPRVGTMAWPPRCASVALSRGRAASGCRLGDPPWTDDAHAHASAAAIRTGTGAHRAGAVAERHTGSAECSERTTDRAASGCRGAGALSCTTRGTTSRDRSRSQSGWPVKEASLWSAAPATPAPRRSPTGVLSRR
jgi:hypothetical protein